METFEDFFDIIERRKWWIIMPFLLVILTGLTYALVAPRVYEAETLILVQPQKVPEDYVRSIVSGDVEDRLKTISQQVTSRTNLERIIQNFDLYDNPDTSLALHRKVELMRRKIKIDVANRSGRRETEPNSFKIFFQYKDATKARDVTNALTANFIEENLRSRESQAIGTSDFIIDELESVKLQLIDKEEELKRYRESYMGGLPEQLETNLSTLERLQAHLDQLHKNLRDAENRRIVVQTQIVEEEKRRAELALSSGSPAQRPRDLPSLRAELTFLKSKYSQRHPNVIQLKEQIRELEAAKAKKEADAVEGETVTEGLDQTLPSQLQEIELEIKSLKAEIPSIRSQIERLQTKVEETPKREQELLTLNRDYENLKGLYESLLQRKLEAKIAVSLERKQKGEQFRVIDPAKVPAEPVKPNMRRLMLLTLLLGLCLGLGLAFLVEAGDKSYKTPNELENDVKLPILMTMPIHYTEKQARIIKLNKALTVTSVVAGFTACAVGIVLTIKGVDWTLTFAKDFVDNLESKIPLQITNLFN